MPEDRAEPGPGTSRASAYGGPGEDEILICCALRFDGYAYAEATGLILSEATDRLVADGVWPESREERLAVFFALQRYLGKWGGEREPSNGKCWRVFRTLFLDLHDAEIPERYRKAEYVDDMGPNGPCPRRRGRPAHSRDDGPTTTTPHRACDRAPWDRRDGRTPDAMTRAVRTERMTPRKKLIEVALPLEAINRESVRENYIYKGNPSSIHKWWAQRPLAACRAVLFASLVDDPDSDPAYAGNPERAAEKRAELFDLIEELVKWESSNNPGVLNRARAEMARCIASRKIETGAWAKDFRPVPGATAWDFNTRRAAPEAVNALLADHAPPVYDPFCGGGSIPLEAQRLGLRAYASDLNPVPVLITKALIEIPPKFAGQPPVNPETRKRLKTATYPGASGLAEDVRYYGKWMRNEAEKRIGHLYPKVKVTPEMAKGRPDLTPYVGQELAVIAWLWARTVASPNPAANGTHVPLVRSFWLSTKPRKRMWVEPVVEPANMTCRFELRTGKGQPREATVGRRGGTCLLTGSPIPLDHIRSEGRAKRLGTRLMAIVAEGNGTRVYLPPRPEDEAVFAKAVPAWRPDTSLPEQALGFRVQGYGMTTHADLFTPRQLVALTTFCGLVGEARQRVLADSGGCEAYADALTTYLAFAVDKATEYNCNLVVWFSKEDRPKGLFARQALSMVWDFAEPNPLCEIGGSFGKSVSIVADVLEKLPDEAIPGFAFSRSATEMNGANHFIISTDPPYYDNVPYADLSDFFYTWLRQMLQGVHPGLTATLLVPKAEELVAEPTRHGGRDEAKSFFEQGMRRVFHGMRNAVDAQFPATIYYAFKQAEGEEVDADEVFEGAAGRTSTGWETFLQGLVDTAWQVDGTWPLRTERTGRIRDNSSNALASSIVLVCRPRQPDAPSASRRDFLSSLRRELPESLRNLQHGNIAPVDLAQAAIGPGMAVFSRYASVIEADGSPMTVRTALQLINQALDEVLAEQEGEFDSDTRWAIAWFDQYGVDEGPFGMAETLSKAKNTSVAGLSQAGLLSAKGGKVRLLRRDELPEDWDPATDARRTVWEVTQHLIRALEKQGEEGAAALLRRAGEQGEVARDLAYRLYSTCERKKWAQEALAYNSLVIAWPQIARLAMSTASAPERQGGLFE